MCVLDEVKERLSIFPNMYDSLRIVDPIKKEVIKINNDSIVHLSEACYGYWNRNQFCENCTSMRAYIQNDTCVKIECKDKSIIFIIATPVEYKGQVFVMEMLKDISKDSVNSKMISDNIEGVSLILKEINKKLLLDELTQIYNKRYISERLPADISKCISDKKPLSIVMIDIDFFKKVNDSYGHVIGDRVLRDFAQFIAEYIDCDTYWIARYGGEEFIIVLNNVNIHGAFNIAEKIRRGLEEKVFKYDDICINITSSFGVYCISEVDDLIKKADENLYKAKQSGRNKTIK